MSSSNGWPSPMTRSRGRRRRGTHGETGRSTAYPTRATPKTSWRHPRPCADEWLRAESAPRRAGGGGLRLSAQLGIQRVKEEGRCRVLICRQTRRSLPELWEKPKRWNWWRPSPRFSCMALLFPTPKMEYDSSSRLPSAQRVARLWTGPTVDGKGLVWGDLVHSRAIFKPRGVEGHAMQALLGANLCYPSGLRMKFNFLRSRESKWWGVSANSEELMRRMLLEPFTSTFGALSCSFAWRPAGRAPLRILAGRSQ